MKQRIFTIIAFFTLIAGLASCSSEKGLYVDADHARFNVIENNPDLVSARGGLLSYIVDANVRWNYELAQGDWIKASRQGNALTLEIAANESGQERASQVRLYPTNSDQSLARVFDIVQAAKSDEPEGPVYPDAPVGKYQIIAHRGHHSDGSTAPQNSIAGLASAQALGVYGSEFDVWITTDGRLVVYHDKEYTGPSGKKRVDESTFAELNAAIKLSNGESIPTLEDFIEQGLKNTAVRLILEVKNHSSADKNTACVNAVVKMIKDKGVEPLMEYISASWDVCLHLRAALTDAPVYYVVDNSNIKTPQQIKDAGLTGLDYKYARYLEHPEYIEEAHNLGLKLNVWTIGDEATFQNCLKMDFDFLTTDMPKSNKEYVDAHPELQE